MADVELAETLEDVATNVLDDDELVVVGIALVVGVQVRPNR